MKNLIIIIIFLIIYFKSISQINFSYFQTFNIPKSPLGASFFVHSKKISFFCDFKISGFKPSEELVKKWSYQKTENEYNFYENTDYGSYKYDNGYMKSRYGISNKYRVFNIGISKSFIKTKSIDLKFFIGLGICRIKKESIKEKETFTYTSWYLKTIDDYYNTSNLSISYEIFKTEIVNKLNVTTGFLSEWIGGGSLGIGYDFKMSGINLMLGFNL